MSKSLFSSIWAYSLLLSPRVKPAVTISTIDGEEAETIVEAIKPKVVIPMHYKTPALKFELNELGDCIKLIKDRPVHYMRSSTAHLSADTLGSDRVIVLYYSKE